MDKKRAKKIAKSFAAGWLRRAMMDGIPYPLIDGKDTFTKLDDITKVEDAIQEIIANLESEASLS